MAGSKSMHEGIANALREKYDTESSKPERISMSKNTASKNRTNLHPLVEKTREDFAEKKTVDKYGMYPAWAKEGLAIRVSPENLDRAYRILDIFARFLEAWGAAFRREIRGRKYSPNSVMIGGYRLEFHLTERSRQFKRRPLKGSWAYRCGDEFETVFEPTGKLSIAFEGPWPYIVHDYRQRKWNDRPGKPIEDYLHEVVDAMFDVVADTKRVEERRTEKKRRKAEARALALFQAKFRRRRKEAINLRQQFIRDKEHELERRVDGWLRARQVQAFIDEIRGQESEEYIRWAERYVERLCSTYFEKGS